MSRDFVTDAVAPNLPILENVFPVVVTIDHCPRLIAAALSRVLTQAQKAQPGPTPQRLPNLSPSASVRLESAPRQFKHRSLHAPPQEILPSQKAHPLDRHRSQNPTQKRRQENRSSNRPRNQAHCRSRTTQSPPARHLTAAPPSLNTPALSACRALAATSECRVCREAPPNHRCDRRAQAIHPPPPKNLSPRTWLSIVST